MSEQKPLPRDITIRFCKLQGKVAREVHGYEYAADCFCSEGNPRHQGGEYYRNDLRAIEYIEQAVAEKMARARPQAAAGLSIYLCRQHGGIGFTSDCRECRAPQAAATEAATGEAEKLQSEIYRLGRTATVMDFNVDPIRDAIAAALTAADLAGYERGLREAAQVVKAEPELEGDPPLSVMHAIQRQGPVPVLRAAVASTKRNIAAAILAKLKGDPQ
jgi:hypothetical protein